ncbi:hypothetical protein CPB83DRAFT_894528 [Crepidotus variabilis]|uniref:Uncharacterized protein n=1 Tax=Crepidotus variabilis TaxID=179855 RepID=A0A9P6EFR8_9AGAR|nr:hypothetical protein CPB83DRAFT_894528 [Crepidotus variabilis]
MKFTFGLLLTFLAAGNAMALSFYKDESEVIQRRDIADMVESYIQRRELESIVDEVLDRRFCFTESCKDARAARQAKMAAPAPAPASR